MCNLMYLDAQKTEFIIISISKTDQPSENVYVAPHTREKPFSGLGWRCFFSY